MATESELLTAIAASPDDATRLVYADWLLARPDERSRKRGELIMLDYKERTTDGGLASPDQMGQLLRLAAELGFPHLPDPDADLLAFEQLGRDNAHWRFTCNGRRYELRRDVNLSLSADGAIAENATLTLAGRWTDAQTNAILTIVLRVVENGVDFRALRFPDPAQLAALPAHRLGPLPRYFSAEVLEDFEADWLLSARDHARWYAIYDRMMKGFTRTSSFKAVTDPVG
ncbi:MAG TPA: TIGR02996 domain-containing protein [Kofleriaceae bacterium]